MMFYKCYAWVMYYILCYYPRRKSSRFPAATVKKWRGYMSVVCVVDLQWDPVNGQAWSFTSKNERKLKVSLTNSIQNRLNMHTLYNILRTPACYTTLFLFPTVNLRVQTFHPNSGARSMTCMLAWLTLTFTHRQLRNFLRIWHRTIISIDHHHQTLCTLVLQLWVHTLQMCTPCSVSKSRQDTPHTAQSDQHHPSVWFKSTSEFEP